MGARQAPSRAVSPRQIDQAGDLFDVRDGTDFKRPWRQSADVLLDLVQVEGATSTTRRTGGDSMRPGVTIHSGRPLPDTAHPAPIWPCYLCGYPGVLRQGSAGGACWLCERCQSHVGSQKRGHDWVKRRKAS